MIKGITKLRLLRSEMGITQEEMAKKLGISRADYNRTELGYFNVPPKKVRTSLEETFNGWTFERLMERANAE